MPPFFADAGLQLIPEKLPQQSRERNQRVCERSVKELLKHGTLGSEWLEKELDLGA
jgi:hypothetical protein